MRIEYRNRLRGFYTIQRIGFVVVRHFHGDRVLVGSRAWIVGVDVRQIRQVRQLRWGQIGETASSNWQRNQRFKPIAPVYFERVDILHTRIDKGQTAKCYGLSLGDAGVAKPDV